MSERRCCFQFDGCSLVPTVEVTWRHSHGESHRDMACEGCANRQEQWWYREQRKRIEQMLAGAHHP